MKKVKQLITIFFTLSICMNVFSQKYVEPFVGYIINNGQNVNGASALTIKQFCVGVQLASISSKRYENIFQLNIGLPITKKLLDSSFTLNPTLPLYKSATKSINIYSANVNFLQKFTLVRFSKFDNLNFLINSGLQYQHINVRYDNDRVNYVILNPDKTLNRFGVVLGVGINYTHYLPKGRIFVQTDAYLPAITARNKYPTQLKSMASVHFIAGYSIPFKSKTNEK